jgi:hypothetical protein
MTSMAQSYWQAELSRTAEGNETQVSEIQCTETCESNYPGHVHGYNIPQPTAEFLLKLALGFIPVIESLLGLIPGQLIV